MTASALGHSTAQRDCRASVRETLEAVFPSLGTYGERLTFVGPPGGTEVVPAESYLRPETLRAAIERAAEDWQTTDLRAVASVWNKHYNAAVLSGPLAAMTLRGIGLDASISRARIVLDGGLPKALLLDSVATSVVFRPRFLADEPHFSDFADVDRVDELHRFVFVRLFQQHLGLIVQQLHGLTGLSAKIMWGNAGNLCADLYDRLARLPDAASTVSEDRVALLERRDGSTKDGRNPLYRTVRYEPLNVPDLPSVVRVRRSCCLKHRLPGHAACYVCPLLGVDERVGLLQQSRTHEAVFANPSHTGRGEGCNQSPFPCDDA